MDLNDFDFDKLLATAHDILQTPLFTLGERPLTPARILGAIVLLAALFWAGRRLRNAIKRWASAGSGGGASDERAGAAVARVVDIVVWIIGFFLVLELFGIQPNSVLAMFAALGVGIGLGLQHLINNFVSGFILLFERPIRVGDLVEVDNRIGTVQRIGWRATLMIDWDNVETLIPNARILEGELVNWTLSDPLARLNVHFGVHYRSDPDAVRAAALEVADNHPAVVDDPKPVVSLVSFGDSSLDWIIRVWTRQPWRRNIIIAELLEHLLRVLRRDQIEIPYPQRDIHVKGDVAAVVRNAD